MPIYRCPVCKTVLSKKKWEKALGVWEARLEHVQHRERELKRHEQELRRNRKEILKEGMEAGKRKEKRRAEHLAKQVGGLLQRDREKDKRIKELEQQLKRGTTPQTEGLLYEDQLAKQLRTNFPQDEIRRTGKGGDVIQRVRTNGRVVGTIVFECKKVQRILKPHVEQAHRAIVQREADFGILVTSGTRARFAGFATERDVLIVNPAGVLFLAQVLRGVLVELAKAKRSRQEREKAARQILSYLESAQFRTQMRDLIERAWKLGEMLNEEVDAHRRTWQRRHDHYKTIFEESCSIGQSLSGILESQLGVPKPVKVLPPARPYPGLVALQTRRSLHA